MCETLHNANTFIARLHKRLFVLMIILGCMSYAAALAALPWGFIVWFLTRSN